LKVKLQYQHDELVIAIKNRDQKAFSYLYDNYSKAIFGIIFNLIGDTEETEDLVQNTFIKIWNSFDSYDSSKGRLYTWMLNIARNIAIDYKRSKISRNKNQNVSNDVYEVKGMYLEDTSSDTIGLNDVVKTLKDDNQLLIDLAYYKGYTQQEISDELNIPLGTVKTKLRKALLILREQLKEKGQVN
jgi:RNA polymerase sigma factor (sigma-70 family)